MKPSDRRTTSVNRRFPRMACVFFLLILCFFGIVFFVQSRIDPLYRYGIAIAGENPVVVSWDPERSSFTVIRIPGFFTVETNHGYGSYQVKALWALDIMEKRNGMLFSDTLSDALGIPIVWFMKSDPLPQGGGAEGRTWLRQTFSLPNLFAVFFHKKPSNIPLPVFVKLMRQAASVGVPSFSSFDIGEMDVEEKETLPDGSVITRFDTTRFDALIGSFIEDDHIRSEMLRVAVVNTTETSGLAQKTARLLEKSGVHVVTLTSSSDQEPVETCLIKGKKEWKDSVTAAFMRKSLQCMYQETDDSSGIADLTLYVGKSMADRYLPYPQ